MRKLLFVPILFTVAMLSACASDMPAVNATSGDAAAVAGVVEEFGGKIDAAETNLAEFTLADLEAAKADADAHNDIIASQCYGYLAAVLPVIRDNAVQNDIKGAFSTFQKARNILKRGKEGISEELTLNCGPLYLDAKRDIKSIPGMIANVAAKFGAKAFLPF